MQVLSHNEDKTIGVVTDPDNLIIIGHFTPALLKEWSEKAIEMFGEGCGSEGGIPVHFRVSDGKGCCSAMYIGEPADNMYVMIAGRRLDVPEEPAGQEAGPESP